MITDIVGYTRIIGDDESTGISILENQESLISPLVLKHDGKIINTTGDGVLLYFPADLQDPPKLIVDFIKYWEQGYDLVYGSRKKRKENRGNVILIPLTYICALGWKLGLGSDG